MKSKEKKVVKPWESKKPPYQIAVDGFTHKDKAKLEDLDHWVPAAYCRPISYELVSLRDDKEKTKTGWWNGIYWDGLRVKREDNIMFWKTIREEVFIG